jgi:alkylation response protein AidB-like acyl-CoA dehydrogenase
VTRLTLPPLEAARKLAPLIRQNADQIDAARELPRHVFEAIADEGVFHVALPHAVDGSQIDLPGHTLMIEELGKADASTAWAVNQGAIFATYAARMPLDAARAIWASKPRSVVSNTPAPFGKAVVVPGGFRVSGKHPFSTGCRHANWVASHAQVIENGEPRMKADGKPEIRYLMIPAEQAEILDTWNVRGMRGTGTHHFEVKDVFVPSELSVLTVGSPLLSDAPLYKVPRTLAFACGDAAVALGVARSCLDAFYQLAGSKSPRYMTGLLRDQVMTQFTVGQAEAQLRSGRAFLMEAIGAIWEEAVSDGELTIERRVALRLATTHSIRLAAQIVDSLYSASGATAAFATSPIQRYFQDIHVITQHLQGRLSHYELVGQHWLGLPIEMTRL